MSKAVQKVKELLEDLAELLSRSSQPSLVPIPVRTRETRPNQRRS